MPKLWMHQSKEQLIYDSRRLFFVQRRSFYIAVSVITTTCFRPRLSATIPHITAVSARPAINEAPSLIAKIMYVYHDM